jgi:hypothetical protein
MGIVSLIKKIRALSAYAYCIAFAAAECHAAPFERVRVITESIHKEAKSCGLSSDSISEAAVGVFRGNKVEIDNRVAHPFTAHVVVTALESSPTTCAAHLNFQVYFLSAVTYPATFGKFLGGTELCSRGVGLNRTRRQLNRDVLALVRQFAQSCIEEIEQIHLE